MLNWIKAASEGDKYPNLGYFCCSDHAAPRPPEEQRSSQKNETGSAKVAEHQGVHRDSKTIED